MTGGMLTEPLDLDSIRQVLIFDTEESLDAMISQLTNLKGMFHE
jgi:hypothetical protein